MVTRILALAALALLVIAARRWKRRRPAEPQPDDDIDWLAEYAHAGSTRSVPMAASGTYYLNPTTGVVVSAN